MATCFLRLFNLGSQSDQSTSTISLLLCNLSQMGYQKGAKDGENLPMAPVRGALEGGQLCPF
jgi:hypothetical protein